jgi:hypothetical protein
MSPNLMNATLPFSSLLTISDPITHPRKPETYINHVQTNQPCLPHLVAFGPRTESKRIPPTVSAATNLEDMCTKARL